MSSYEQNRGIELKQEALQREINKNRLVVDRGVFAKSSSEKIALANAKMDWKKNQKKVSK